MESACVLREDSGANFHYVTLDGRPQDLRALAEYLRLGVLPTDVVDAEIPQMK